MKDSKTVFLYVCFVFQIKYWNVNTDIWMTKNTWKLIDWLIDDKAGRVDVLVPCGSLLFTLPSQCARCAQMFDMVFDEMFYLFIITGYLKVQNIVFIWLYILTVLL